MSPAGLALGFRMLTTPLGCKARSPGAEQDRGGGADMGQGTAGSGISDREDQRLWEEGELLRQRQREP